MILSTVVNAGDTNTIEIVFGKETLHVPTHLIMNDGNKMGEFFSDLVGLDRKPSTYLSLQYKGKDLYGIIEQDVNHVSDDLFISVTIQMLTEYELKRMNTRIDPWFKDTWGLKSLVVHKMDDNLFIVKRSNKSIGWDFYLLDPIAGSPLPKSQFDAYVGGCSGDKSYDGCHITMNIENLDVKIHFPSELHNKVLVIMRNIKKAILSWIAPSLAVNHEVEPSIH